MTTPSPAPVFDHLLRLTDRRRGTLPHAQAIIDCAAMTSVRAGLVNAEGDE